MAKLRLSREWLLEVMQSDPVRHALSDKADDISNEVEAEAALDAYYADGRLPLPDVQVSAGTRPGGRPYARVAVPKEDEYGDYSVPKRRILGRLAARHNTPKGG